MMKRCDRTQWLSSVGVALVSWRCGTTATKQISHQIHLCQSDRDSGFCMFDAIASDNSLWLYCVAFETVERGNLARVKSEICWSMASSYMTETHATFGSQLDAHAAKPRVFQFRLVACKMPRTTRCLHWKNEVQKAKYVKTSLMQKTKLYCTTGPRSHYF